MIERELRTLRRRQADLIAAMDTRPGTALMQGPVRSVQVYAEATVPTAVEKYFACHPLRVSGTETEGTAISVAADTAQTLYVAVLGPKVPVAGDRLLARLVGGRWVADSGKSGAAAPPCGTFCIHAQSSCTGNPTIDGASVTLSIKQVTAVSVGAGGSGYTGAPTVVFATTNGTGATATATIAGGVVTGIAVTNGGGYSAAPLISFTGGGGSGATATATLGGSTTVGTGTTTGQVVRLSSTGAGSGYTSVPTVTIAAPPSGVTATAVAVMGTTNIASVALTAGGGGYTSPPTAAIGGTIHGSGTTLTVKLVATTVGGVTITAPGSGYTNGTGYAISFNNTGSAGGGAAGTFDVVGGSVTNPVITNGGSGYTSLPTVTFPGAGGSGAAGTVALSPAAVGTLTRTTAGSNYQVGDAPTVVFSGGGGTGASGTATLGTFGVASYAMTDLGSGYAAAGPAVTVTGGGGTLAGALAIVSNQACVPITTAGLYTIAGSAAGFGTGTATFAATNCASVNGGNPVAVTLTPTLVQACMTINSPCGATPLTGESMTIAQGGSTLAAGTIGAGVGGGGANNLCVMAPVSTSTTYSSPLSLHSPARFAPFTNTATTPICPPSSGGGTATVASGYVCFAAAMPNCAYPPSKTLMLMDSVYGGPVTLTWDAANQWWQGSQSASVPACVAGGCTATAATITYTLFNRSLVTNISFSISANGAAGTCGNYSFTTNSAPGSVTCPPSLSMTYTVGTLGSAGIYCASGPATITITE